MLVCDVSTPVVVLQGGCYGGLGIVRSLGRLGVPVCVVHPETWGPARHSRYCCWQFTHDIENDSPPISIAFLRDLGKKLGRRAVLVPTTDASTMFVDEHAGILREWFIFPERPAGLARSLCSKKQMHMLASRHGAPTAETAFPQCRRDVQEYLERARFPIVLKGIYGQKMLLRGSKPVSIVHNAAELLEQYDALEDPAEPNLMLQEYIPGAADTIWMFNGYFDGKSECILGFTGRKLRQCPVDTGPTCLGICQGNEHVARATRDFMRAIGYRGVLDIDYRYDARDGQYKLLDVNPRIGATFRLFVATNGVDVARALYLDMTGQPIEPAPAKDGRKWIVEDWDLISCWRYHRDGKLTFREWLLSVRGIHECAVWASDDPVPLACMFAADAREALSRIASRLPRVRRKQMDTSQAT